MNVVGHQAPCPDGHPAGPAMLAQEFNIEPVIILTEEHRLAPIAALGDVVRDVGHDRPRKLGHGVSLSSADRHQKSLVRQLQNALKGRNCSVFER